MSLAILEVIYQSTVVVLVKWKLGVETPQVRRIPTQDHASPHISSQHQWG